MKKEIALIEPIEISAFSFLKGHNQAISWVTEIGESRP